MQNLEKLRLLTINYSKLQGLRAVPLGALLLLVVLWANLRPIHLSGLTAIVYWAILILIAGGAALAYGWIDRYYTVHYGKVEPTGRQKRVEYTIGVVGGLVALPAVIIDLWYPMPVILVGFVFAAAVLFEFLRTYRVTLNRYYLWQSLGSLVIILGVDLLPVFGWVQWGKALGLHNNLFALLVVVSLVMLVSGTLGHIIFARQLPTIEESAQ